MWINTAKGLLNLANIKSIELKGDSINFIEPFVPDPPGVSRGIGFVYGLAAQWKFSDAAKAKSRYDQLVKEIAALNQMTDKLP